MTLLILADFYCKTFTTQVDIIIFQNCVSLIYISKFSCSGHIGYIVTLNCNKVFVDQVFDALLEVCLLHGEALSGKVLD